MKKVKIGMVGAGFVSKIHMDAYEKVIGIPVEVAGIVSGTRAKAEAFAEDYGIKRVYKDYREMLDDKEIDAVDICAPPYRF